MNHNILYILLISCISIAANSQTIDTVSTAANYQNQLWYNLNNGTKTTVVGDSWDLGFQINGTAASILANTAYGAELYRYPNGDISDWSTLDTAGISQWTSWHNSSSDWDKGAFNMGRDTAIDEDLGWGKYNHMTHAITGDSLYVWKTADGKIFKIWIQKLASATYHFLISDYSNHNIDTVALAKSNFTNKDFAYYSIAQNSILDLEPANTDWDLTFGKYIENLGMPYSVSGIRTNKRIEAVKVYPIANPDSYDSVQNYSYTSAINTIGHDWKKFDLNSSTYSIQDSTVYFLKKDTVYWKLIMRGFGGSSNGDFIFEKTKIENPTGLFKNKIQNQGAFMVYPNPTSERKITVVADLPESTKDIQVNILSINGKLVQSEQLKINNTFEAFPIHLSNLSQGVYFLRLNHNEGSITKKLILK